MNVDWKLLREQKEALVLHMMNGTPIRMAHLDGIIHFIDAFQDYTVDNGDATELEVFGDLTGV